MYLTVVYHTLLPPRGVRATATNCYITLTPEIGRPGVPVVLPIFFAWLNDCFGLSLSLSAQVAPSPRNGRHLPLGVP